MGRPRVKPIVFCAVSLIVAACVAVLLTYSFSFDPFYARSKLQLGAANAKLLVETDQSPLADANTYLGNISFLGSNIAQLTDSSFVRRAAARALGVASGEIGIRVQISEGTGENAFNGSQPIRALDVLQTKAPYQVTVVANTNSFIIEIYTDTSTGHSATILANSVAGALTEYVRSLGKTVRGRARDRVTVEQLSPAVGGQLGSSAGPMAAVTIAVVSWLLLLLPFWLRQRATRCRRNALHVPVAAAQPQDL